MIGLIRDRELDTNRPIIIVYKRDGRKTEGFIIIMDEQCIVKPYREYRNRISYGEQFRVRYTEIIKFIQNDDRRKLYNYLTDKVIGNKLDY